jgi:hypothetical protein
MRKKWRVNVTVLNLDNQVKAIYPIEFRNITPNNEEALNNKKDDCEAFMLYSYFVYLAFFPTFIEYTILM